MQRLVPFLARLSLVALLLGLVTAGVGGGVLGGYLASGPSPDERALTLLQRNEALWTDPDRRQEAVAALRQGNPEWDFMWRTFLALSAVDRALAHPDETDRWLALVDDIVDDTVAMEATGGHEHYLLPYARRRAWHDPRARSVFVDGELALVLGARRLVRDDDPALARAHRARIRELEDAFAAAPEGLPESYPDEAWLFCVTNALVALRIADVLDGTDHDPLIRRFVARARTLLAEPGTGLLGSDFTADAEMLDGPEGSSLWLVATNLLVLDDTLAHEQYDGATEHLFRRLLGMGWSSEWGPGWRGPVDIDSGPLVPLLDASPSASAFALGATRAFGDEDRHRALARSLRAADLLVALDPRYAELASHPMGDVIVLHGLTFGPLWATVRQAGRP